MTSQPGNLKRRRPSSYRAGAKDLGQTSYDVPPARRIAITGLTLVLLSVPLLAFWGAYQSLNARSAAQDFRGGALQRGVGRVGRA
jgi:hypothetical protein